MYIIYRDKYPILSWNKGILIFKSVAIVTNVHTGERLYSFHSDKVLDFPIRLLKARGKYMKDKAPRRYHGLAMLHSARAPANK